MEINKQNLMLFWKFVSERHLIYKRKNILGLPFPWTDDEILKEYKFTNVFRDIDPGTRFVIERIIPGTDSFSNLLFNILIYRIYNKIETFSCFGLQDHSSFDRRTFEKKLRSFSSEGNKVFTGAFIVSGYEFLKEEGDKIARTSRSIEIFSKDIPDISASIKEARDSRKTFETIRSIKGIGEFLGYQVCVDLGYARKDVFDEDIFVIAGPGCKRGLDWIFISRGELSYEGCIRWLEENQFKGFGNLQIDIEKLFEDREEKKLNLMAIENCLCEFSKYMKAKTGEGRPRNRYNGILKG